MDVQPLLRKLITRNDLAEAETHALFEGIMTGAVAPELLAGVLTALATKGETVAELVGAARVMREKVTRVAAPAGRPVIDTCGTGGDGKPTFNVSSAVAVVAAAAGAVVAKHGNRSNARPSGSAEGLAALGINVDADVATVERCLADCGVGFLYAINLHPAMKHAGPVRRALGVRTIFNLIGPLTNPAGAQRQLLGVSRPEHVELMADALRRLGAQRAMVVHGLEGLCDLSLSGRSRVARWTGTAIEVEELDCSVVDATPAPLEAVYVDGPTASAATIERIFDGEPGPPRDLVVFNAAAALWVAGLADDWSSGATAARAALDAGKAAETLAAWRRISTGS